MGATSLEKLLEQHQNEIHLIGSADSIEAGYELIKQGRAHWVVLEMGSGPQKTTLPPTASDTVENQGQFSDHLILPSKKGYEVVPLEQVVWLEAQGGYTIFHLQAKTSLLSSHSLSYYEARLPRHFHRIHKSHLINCQKIISFETGRSGRVFLEDGAELRIAARRRRHFLHLLQDLSSKTD